VTVTRDELIEALERAAGPSRELDGEIAKAVGQPHGRFGYADEEQEIARCYTASIDAAVELAGEYEWEIKTAPHRKGGIARIVTMERTTWAEAATPTIALCIAALKARPSDAS
jgi:hypothetical protein